MFTVEQFKGTIYENGFGMIPKKVMCDKELSSNAKVLYAFLASHSFNGGKATPKKMTINNLLGWSEGRTDRTLKELKEKGLIQVEKYLIPKKERTNPKQRYRNHYVLTNSLQEIADISIKEKKKEGKSEKKSVEKIKPKKVETSKEYQEIKEKPKKIEDKIILEKLKGFGVINSQTLKNLKKYSKNSIEEIEKAKDYIKKSNKELSIPVLIAILRDKDYLKPISEKTSKPKKMTRKEKIEAMKKKLGSQKVNKIREEIKIKFIKYKNRDNFESLVELELEKVIEKWEKK